MPRRLPPRTGDLYPPHRSMDIPDATGQTARVFSGLLSGPVPTAGPSSARNCLRSARRAHRVAVVFETADQLTPVLLLKKCLRFCSLDPYLRSLFKRDFCGSFHRPFSALFATYRPSPPHPRKHSPRTLMLDYQKAVNPPFGARALILTAWRPVKNPRDWCVWRLVVSCAFLQSSAPTGPCKHSHTYVWSQGTCKV